MSNNRNPLAGGTSLENERTDASEEYKGQDITGDINALLRDLEMIADKYDKTIRKLQETYNQKQMQYKDAYDQFQESTRYKVADKELEKQRKRLRPYEDHLRSAGQELNRVKKRKETESLQVLQHIQDKQNKYVHHQTAVLQRKARQLRDLRKQYIELLQEAGEVYANTAQIDEVFKGYYKRYKKPFKNTAMHELNRLTDGLSPTDLEVNADDIKEALRRN